MKSGIILPEIEKQSSILDLCINIKPVPLLQGLRKFTLKVTVSHIGLMTGPDNSADRLSAPGNGRSWVRSRTATYQSR